MLNIMSVFVTTLSPLPGTVLRFQIYHILFIRYIKKLDMTLAGDSTVSIIGIYCDSRIFP